MFVPLLALPQCGILCEASEKKNEVTKEKQEPQLSSSSMLDPRAVPLLDPRADLLPQLLDFDEVQRQKAFDGKVFGCGICFVEKLGSGCLCFKECQHVYCKACMTEYFQIQIRDGNVQGLCCPEPKCTSLATPLQVREGYLYVLKVHLMNHFSSHFYFVGETAGGWGSICALRPFAAAVQSGPHGWCCLLSPSVLWHCCDGGAWHNHGHLLRLPLCFLHTVQNGLSRFIPL